MTIGEIKAALGAVDPEIRYGWTMGKGQDYTWWETVRRLPIVADDCYIEEGWSFVVHRFTRRADDPVAPALFRALDAMPEFAVSWATSPDPGTEYIHHVFDCEAV